MSLNNLPVSFVPLSRQTRQDKTIYYNLCTPMVLQEDNNYTLAMTYIIIHLHTINELVISYIRGTNS